MSQVGHSGNGVGCVAFLDRGLELRINSGNGIDMWNEEQETLPKTPCECDVTERPTPVRFSSGPSDVAGQSEDPKRFKSPVLGSVETKLRPGGRDAQ